jgi:phosphonate transport system substrate-binding protein
MRNVGLATTRSLILFAIVAWACIAPAQDKPRPFGVLNQQSPALTAERWNPILHYVSTASGVPLALRMGATVTETNGMMGRGEFDFVFSNHNFQTEYDGVYKVIARWGGDPIHGVIAVPSDSGVQRVKDLDGKRVAFPSPDAFVAYAVPRLALRQSSVRFDEIFAGNQEGVLAQLKARRVDAGAVNSRFLRQYEQREGVVFRKIFTSDGYPDLAVVAHPRVPPATVERVRQALLGMKADPKAAPIMVSVKFSGFDPASERDYDGVRRVYRQIGQ